MSTRATILVHGPRCTSPKSKTIVKLYQHCDGYEDGLGIALIRGFQNMKQPRHLDYCLKKANRYHQNRFEITTGRHGDTEYMYHIYINKDGVMITYQTGDYGDDYLIELPEQFLLSKEFNGKALIETSLKEKIEGRELYQLKSLFDCEKIDQAYNDYIFTRRFEIYDCEHFRSLIKDDITAYFELWNRTDIDLEQKSILEDQILKNIKDTLDEERRYEEHIYYRNSI